MGQHVHTGDLDIWTQQVGEGPDVLLIGGAGDTVESWQSQLDGPADRYRMTAFDRAAGRTAMPSGPVSAETTASDAAGVLRATGDGPLPSLVRPFRPLAGRGRSSATSTPPLITTRPTASREITDARPRR